MNPRNVPGTRGIDTTRRKARFSLSGAESAAVQSYVCHIILYSSISNNNNNTDNAKPRMCDRVPPGAAVREWSRPVAARSQVKTRHQMGTANGSSQNPVYKRCYVLELVTLHKTCCNTYFVNGGLNPFGLDPPW